MPLSTGQVLNNRYRIVKLLGQGGFGAVYRAWDTNLDCPRALKENFDVSPEAQRQFKREAQILTVLSHPNLPKVIDHFVVPDQGQYLVMDYIEGEDLETMLQKAGDPLPEAQVLPWMLQVCDALEYLHSQNPPVIHRDIKPGNIKITPQGKAMLVDFGIAKVYDPNLRTTAGARAVTPGYSPQEQYGSGVTDARTDIYALGATLYHLLTGVQPLESIQRNIDDTLVTPRKLNPNISIETENAVLKAMQPHPKQRFQSMSDFRQALMGPVINNLPQPVHVQTQTVQSSGIPVSAPPASMTLSSAPQLSPRRWSMNAGMKLFALLIVGISLIAVGYGLANRTVDDERAMIPTSTVARIPDKPTQTAISARISTNTPVPTATKIIITPTFTVIPTPFLSHVDWNEVVENNVSSREIFIVYTDGTEVYLTQNTFADEDPVLSPAGNLIAFSRYLDTNGDGKGDFDDNADIFIIDLEGGNVRNLTDNPANDSQPSWSPDGKALVFRSDRLYAPEWGGEVYKYNMDSGVTEQLTVKSGWGGWPSWSPDGQYIAFYSSDASGSYVSIISPDGSDQRRLTDDVGNGWGLSWSKTGLLCFPYREEQYVIYPDGTGARVRTDADACTWAGYTQRFWGWWNTP